MIRGGMGRRYEYSCWLSMCPLDFSDMALSSRVVVMVESMGCSLTGYGGMLVFGLRWSESAL
jgi:hypothetical protein